MKSTRRERKASRQRARAWKRKVLRTFHLKHRIPKGWGVIFLGLAGWDVVPYSEHGYDYAGFANW